MLRRKNAAGKKNRPFDDDDPFVVEQVRKARLIYREICGKRFKYSNSKMAAALRRLRHFERFGAWDDESFIQHVDAVLDYVLACVKQGDRFIRPRISSPQKVFSPAVFGWVQDEDEDEDQDPWQGSWLGWGNIWTTGPASPPIRNIYGYILTPNSPSLHWSARL
jgi:hypothetical protein